MEEGKNIFLLDGPIGRKKFLIYVAIIFVYLLLFSLLVSVILGFGGVNIYTKKIVEILIFIFKISVIYMFFITYTKRLCDIINCSKWKALFYVLLCFTGLLALGYIPVLKYLCKPIAFIFFICLSFIKGHLLGSNENMTEAQVIDGEQNQA